MRNARRKTRLYSRKVSKMYSGSTVIDFILLVLGGIGKMITTKRFVLFVWLVIVILVLLLLAVK
jgi:hypothetical protein